MEDVKVIHHWNKLIVVSGIEQRFILQAHDMPDYSFFDTLDGIYKAIHLAKAYYTSMNKVYHYTIYVWNELDQAYVEW